MTTIFQITNQVAFEQYEQGIFNLLSEYKNTLMDDSCNGDPLVLLENLKACIPFIWILLSEVEHENGSGKVLALSNLTDEVPGRHAFVHGVSLPQVWKTGEQTQIALEMMKFAFEKLNVLKLKAEFETINPLAKGFCWRFGFKREAFFKDDISIDGALYDVVVYSLTRQQFYQKYKKLQQNISAA